MLPARSAVAEHSAKCLAPASPPHANKVAARSPEPPPQRSALAPPPSNRPWRTGPDYQTETRLQNLGKPVSAPFGSTCNVMAPPSRVRGASTTLSRGYLRPVTASRGSLSPDSIELLMPSWARIFPWLSIGNSLGRAWTKSPREGPTAMHDTGRHGRGKRRNRRGGDGSTARRQGQFPSLAFPLRLFIVALHPLPPNGRTVGCLRNCMMQARWRRVARVGWLWLLDRLSLCFLFVLPAPAGSVTPVLCPQSRQGRTTDVYDTSGGGVERPSPGNPSGASCLGWVPRNTHDCLRHTMVAVRQCGVK